MSVHSKGVFWVPKKVSGNSGSHETTLLCGGCPPKSDIPILNLRLAEAPRCTTTLIHTFMTNLFCKGGRPWDFANKCSHHVKVSFDDLEWDEPTRMMEKANATVKATFIKQLIFGKPFKVLVTDKSLAVYCAKLSEFSHNTAQSGKLRPHSQNPPGEFHREKAMTLLCKLEKATIEMIGVMSQVMSLSEKFEQQWSLKSR